MTSDQTNMTSMEEPRRKVVDTANAMLAGRLSLIAGSRILCGLRYSLGETESPAFLPIVGFESETDWYPIDGARSAYSEEYLRRADEEIDGYLKDCTPWVLEACREIIVKFS